jgi:hypothetical protein
MACRRVAAQVVVFLSGCAALAGCATTETPSNPPGGTGGVTPGSGGATTSGGASASGGTPSGGAASSTGGTAPSGGASASGGTPSGGTVSSTGGTAPGGGASASGGISTGGIASSTGGTASGGSPAGGIASGGLSTGGTGAGGKASGGTPAGGNASGGTTSSGGATSTGGTPTGACTGSCSNAAAGSCSAPQVRVTSVSLGSSLNYSTDETYNIPLAIAAKPGGGSRIAWMTGYSHYGSSTTSQVHVAELDCDDKLVGTPFTLQAHDFQDIAADANGGVITLTRDGASAFDAQHCGDVNNLCVLPSDRPGCYDHYMVRYDCSGSEQWATKLTTTTSSAPLYTPGSGSNHGVWWYQHHGRLAYDGTNYAAYFCDSITIANTGCGANKVDIHEGDRMQVVGPTGSVLTGHDSFAGGCSHSWTTRLLWDPRTSHFVMACATDNSCRIAQPNPYRTIVSATCDGTLFGGDIVNAGTTGYWLAWSYQNKIRLEHFTTGASDQTVSTAGTSQHPHLVAYGNGRMLLTWGSGSSMAAQVYDSSTGATVGSQFTIAAPDHPWQSFKPYPDGSVAFASVASASSTIQITRVLPCSG